MVGVLTVAPWHNSIGDIATAECTVAYLAASGIPTLSLAAALPGVDTFVIGGGNILYGGDEWPWKQLLRAFRPSGAHILNAAGADLDTMHRIDWSYLAEYPLVSVRDNATRDKLSALIPDVHVKSVPCPATLVRPFPWPFVRSLPAHRELAGLQPGDYVVFHRHPAVVPFASGQSCAKVAVDMQAWHQHPWHAKDCLYVSTHSPNIVQAVVSNARAVVTHSLHLAIFALAAKTPFVVVDREDAQSNKIRYYMERAGIPEVMFTARLGDPVKYAESLRPLILKASATEHQLARQHLDDIVSLLRRNETGERRAAEINGPRVPIFDVDQADQRLLRDLDSGRRTWEDWHAIGSRASEELAALIPLGSTLILIDDNQLGDKLISQRSVVPFVERDGAYWGRPEDDAMAIDELQRMRQSGASFLAFAWPAFWWLDYYSGFHSYLREKYQCVLQNDRLVVFDLRTCLPVPGS